MTYPVDDGWNATYTAKNSHAIDLETGEIYDASSPSCPGCAQALTERVQAEADLQAAERELRKLRRANTLLRNELNKQRVGSPDAYLAEAVFCYWVARFEKNSKITVFGEKRQEKVLARLKEHDATYIARAIDGFAMSFYTAPNGKRFDDLELVCRDEVKLEGFYEFAERTHAPTLIGEAWHEKFAGTLPEPETDGTPF
jgi:hypothetical protein